MGGRNKWIFLADRYYFRIDICGGWNDCKGANVAVLINPAAAIIIFVGVIAAVINSFPSSDIKNPENLRRSAEK